MDWCLLTLETGDYNCLLLCVVIVLSSPFLTPCRRKTMSRFVTAKTFPLGEDGLFQSEPAEAAYQEAQLCMLGRTVTYRLTRDHVRLILQAYECKMDEGRRRYLKMLEERDASLSPPTTTELESSPPAATTKLHPRGPQDLAEIVSVVSKANDDGSVTLTMDTVLRHPTSGAEYRHRWSHRIPGQDDCDTTVK